VTAPPGAELAPTSGSASFSIDATTIEVRHRSETTFTRESEEDLQLQPPAGNVWGNRAEAEPVMRNVRSAQAPRRAVWRRRAPVTPFNSTGPIWVNVTDVSSATSTTS
jgi:hypothetical protein